MNKLTEDELGIDAVKTPEEGVQNPSRRRFFDYLFSPRRNTEQTSSTQGQGQGQQENAQTRAKNQPAAEQGLYTRREFNRGIATTAVALGVAGVVGELGPNRAEAEAVESPDVFQLSQAEVSADLLSTLQQPELDAFIASPGSPTLFIMTQEQCGLLKDAGIFSDASFEPVLSALNTFPDSVQAECICRVDKDGKFHLSLPILRIMEEGIPGEGDLTFHIGDVLTYDGDGYDHFLQKDETIKNTTIEFIVMNDSVRAYFDEVQFTYRGVALDMDLLDDGAIFMIEMDKDRRPLKLVLEDTVFPLTEIRVSKDGSRIRAERSTRSTEIGRTSNTLYKTLNTLTPEQILSLPSTYKVDHKGRIAVKGIDGYIWFMVEAGNGIGWVREDVAGDEPEPQSTATAMPNEEVALAQSTPAPSPAPEPIQSVEKHRGADFLKRNELNLFTIVATIDEVDYNVIQLSENIKVQVSATLKYKDESGNDQKVKVPLLFRNTVTQITALAGMGTFQPSPEFILTKDQANSMIKSAVGYNRELEGATVIFMFSDRVQEYINSQPYSMGENFGDWISAHQNEGIIHGLIESGDPSGVEQMIIPWTVTPDTGLNR
ncbi:MAG: hypothetical protein ABI425_04680 [Patescibacteria group bacterium]